MTVPKVSTNDCWLWASKVSEKGYGIMYALGRRYKAHRVVYESEVGQIPEGLEIDHLCKVTECVNPHHLEPVTHQLNMERKYGKDMCMRGHKLTPDNIYKSGIGGRQCKTCAKDYQRKKYWNRHHLTNDTESMGGDNNG